VDPFPSRRRRRQLLPLQPHSLPLRHARQPFQDAAGRRRVQPGRHGVLGGRGVGGARPGAPPNLPQFPRARRVDGEHHPELVLWQQPVHAHPQLPVPRRRRGAVHDKPESRPVARQVRTVPRRAHAHRRRGRGVPVRVPGPGRGGRGENGEERRGVWIE
jgi:hypothetical protein